jgi:hypothetical protein
MIMNARILIVLFVFLGLILSDCSKKGVDFCGTPALINRTTIESRILSLKTVGFSDTITASLKGIILCKDSTESAERVDTLSYALIRLITHDRVDTVQIVSDIHGSYEEYFKAGVYDIFIGYVGYNALEIKNVKFGIGEFKELNVLLGQIGKVNAKTVVDSEY